MNRRNLWIASRTRCLDILTAVDDTLTSAIDKNQMSVRRSDVRLLCPNIRVNIDVARSSVNLHRLKLIRDAVDDRGDTGEKRVDESLLVRATMFRTGRNVEEFCTCDRGLA